MEVVAGLPVAQEWPLDHPDFLDPLDPRHSVPSAHNGSERKAVVDRERLVIHRVGEQDAVRQSLYQGQAPRERDRSGRGGLLAGIHDASISADQDHLDRVAPNPGFGQNVSQSHSGPGRVANRPALPLQSFLDGFVEDAPVPRTFHDCGQGGRRHGLQLI